MKHDFSIVFETDNEYWKRVLEIFDKSEHYPKKIVSGRNLHHKFPKSFSKMLGEPIDNSKENLISLSLSEHFLVHYYYYLLAKKGFKQRMATAFTFMVKSGIKYITPDTAEKIAKDYEEAVKISEQYNKERWDDTKRTEHSNKIKSVLKEYYKTHEVWNKGKTYSDEHREKISKGVAEYCSREDVRKYRSEHRKGKPHPHKSGRKGIPTSIFGKAFFNHYGYLAKENNKLYKKELKYWKNNSCFSWESMEKINTVPNSEK